MRRWQKASPFVFAGAALMMSLVVAGHSAGGHLAAMVAGLPGVSAALPISGLFDLEPRFKFILTSEDIEQGKPATDVYLLAAKKHGVEPTEMMILEDSPSPTDQAGSFSK